MTARHERRSRLMGFKIKQQSWDLEDHKKKNRSAQEDLEAAQKALHEIEAAIDEAENALRQGLMGQLNLDLDAIQAAGQFLVDQQALRKRRSKDRQRATQKAEQAEKQLKQAVLYVKALKQIKASSDKEINRVQENQMAEQLAELWRQRYGRNEWLR